MHLELYGSIEKNTDVKLTIARQQLIINTSNQFTNHEREKYMIADLVENASESAPGRYVLLTGFSKSGKTYQAAQVLASRKTLWLSAGETDGYRTALIAASEFGVKDFDIIHLERLFDHRSPISALRKLLRDLAKDETYQAVVVDSIDGLGRWFERAMQFSNANRILTKEGAVKFERDHFGQKKSFLSELAGYLLPALSLSGKDVIAICGLAHRDITGKSGSVHTKTVIDLSGSMSVELPRYFSLVCEVQRVKRTSFVYSESEDADLGGRLAVPAKMSAIQFREWIDAGKAVETEPKLPAPEKAVAQKSAKPKKKSKPASKPVPEKETEQQKDNEYILRKGDICANGKYVGLDAKSKTLTGWHFLAALAFYEDAERSDRDKKLIDLAFDKVSTYALNFFEHRHGQALEFASENNIFDVFEDLKAQDKAISRLWLSNVSAVSRKKTKDYGEFSGTRYDD